MRKLAGLVFDAHDDLDGRVLKGLIPNPTALPDFVKTAHRLTGDQIDRLTDDNFALVMLNEGQKIKKYAMVDKGNVALSIMYLGHQAHLLPPEAVKTAATNLCGACQQQGMVIPGWLKMAAEAGVSGVSGKGQAPYAKKAKVNKINFPIGENPKETTLNPQLGKVEPVDRDTQDRTNYGGTQGTNFMELPIFSQKERLTGSSTPMEKKAAEGQLVLKEKLFKTSPYVDVSGWDPQAHQLEDHKAPEQTLLPGRYPVDSYDQIKTASVYFAENWKGFHPRDRHDYCIKLAVRMGQMGMEVPEDVARYGAPTYAADVDSMVESRRGLIDVEHFGPALDALIEKRAQVDPETFVGAVEQFDHMTGLNYFWDSHVPDPWYTTFGPNMEKLAAGEWTWNEGGVFIDLQDLERLAMNGKFLVKKQFGPEFVERFSKNPKGTFTGLPKTTQLILARMASDKHAGTATE